MKELLEVLGLIGLVVSGVFAVIGIFSKQKKDIASDVIKLQNEKISALEDKTKDQDIKIAESAVKIADLTKLLESTYERSKVFSDLLQGKDANAKEMYQRIKEIDVKIDEILKRLTERV